MAASRGCRRARLGARQWEQALDQGCQVGRRLGLRSGVPGGRRPRAKCVNCLRNLPRGSPPHSSRLASSRPQTAVGHIVHVHAEVQRGRHLAHVVSVRLRHRPDAPPINLGFGPRRLGNAARHDVLVVLRRLPLGHVGQRRMQSAGSAAPQQLLEGDLFVAGKYRAEQIL